MIWLIANLFLMVLICFMAGMMLLAAFCLRSVGLEPDLFPGLSSIAVMASLFVAYLLSKRFYLYLSKL